MWARRWRSPVDQFGQIERHQYPDGAGKTCADLSNTRAHATHQLLLAQRSAALGDLPGYGFAKVPLAVKKKWNQQLERYLQYRESLRGLVMLMDIRHPLTDPDKQMLGWAVTASMQFTSC